MIKVLSYNLRDGAKDTYDSLVAFINAERPDVLCLQEANGWHIGSPARIETFAKAAGFREWRFGDSNTDFKLVTFSRLPIAASQTVTDNFWHSALRTTVTWDDMQLDIWNTHLDPRAPQNRLAEAEQLISSVGGKHAIITGDLNSISKEDAYPADLLNKLLARGIEKFGTEKLSFDELERFAGAGFVDIASRRHAMEPTVPTPANDDADHAVSLRLDYFLASPELEPFVKAISVIRNDLTDRISDHYPIAMALENHI